jgi:hypothetical protein
MSCHCLPFICFESKNEPQHGMFTATCCCNQYNHSGMFTATCCCDQYNHSGMFTATCCCDQYNHSLQSCAKTIGSFWMNTRLWGHSVILWTWHATQDQSLTQFWSLNNLRLAITKQWLESENIFCCYQTLLLMAHVGYSSFVVIRLCC